MEPKLIAPCGMNCALCVAYYGYRADNKPRKNTCPGCRPRDKGCAFLKKHCSLIAKHQLDFCYECDDYPCTHLTRLDTGYQKRYKMSMINNLNTVRDQGMDIFLAQQAEEYRCDNCGGTISVHTRRCYTCNPPPPPKLEAIKISSLMDELIARWQHRRLGVLFLLKIIPQSSWSWRPYPEARTTAELATHLAASPQLLYEGLQGNIPDEATYTQKEHALTPKTPAGLVKLYEKGLTKLLSYLKQHKSDAFDATIKFFYHDKKRCLYDEATDELGHIWLHLGQLYLYLRLNKIQVDMGAYYGYKDPNPQIPPTA